MRHLASAGLLAAAALLPVASSQQLPGEFPRLFADDGAGNQAPGNSGPFDNSAVFITAAGTGFDARISYLAEGGASLNDDVAWGLLVSLAQTPFPAAEPPPLFTMPPFVFVAPTPLLLDAGGTGAIGLSIPQGMVEGTFYLQAIVQDASSAKNLALSNGVAVQIQPPGFNARFGFMLEQPALGSDDFQGAGSADIGPEVLSQVPPYGAEEPPPPVLDDLGLPTTLRFLELLPNTPDTPINPLARPLTELSEELTGSQAIDVFPVVDTSGFPASGTIFVARTGENPWNDRTTISAPDMEAVHYTSKSATAFLGCTRQVLGSTGSSAFPHDVGDLVLGEFTMATTAGALARTRVGLDVRNAQMPHIVIPEFSFTAEPAGTVSMDLDLYLYERDDTGAQGFLVHDRVSGAWRVIDGSEIDTSDGSSWNRMVHVSPDGRFIVAARKVVTGAEFVSDPDELWMLRLDGLDWPASGGQSWQVEFELLDDPSSGEVEARSRAVYMPSVRVGGLTPEDFVAFVGLKSKWAQSSSGSNNNLVSGYEGFYVREEVIVKEYIDVPLVPPGSIKAIPSEPRPYIASKFPATGNGSAVARFDPVPLASADHKTIFMVAGASETNEDMYSIRGITITAGGASSYAVLNISGFGFNGGLGTNPHELRAFDQGGHGNGQRGTVSPDGLRVAFMSPESAGRDWLHVARASGADFALVADIYKEVGGTNFKETGKYRNERGVRGVRWVDNDRLMFSMGKLQENDPLAFNSSNEPALDIFQYTVSTDFMEPVINTSTSGQPFVELGVLQQAATFLSADRRYFYFVRSGERCVADCDGTPVTVPVTNLIAVDTQTGTAFDVTGDELGTGAVLGDLRLPEEELRAPIETPAGLKFVEASGVQDGLLYLVAHLQGDVDETDEIFAVDLGSPAVVFAATSDSAAGSHVSNVTPNPYSSSAAFARTAGSDPLANDQHPFVVDLDNFLFLRDLAPTAVFGGSPFGRVMDGSFHFLPADPANGAGDALVFSFGLTLDPNSGVAQTAAPVYYSLANLSDTLLEPTAVLLPLMNTFGLGPGYAVSIASAGLSQE